MPEIPNPYLEDREKAPGEVAQEYADLIRMGLLFLGIHLTDREKDVIPILVGAFLRERSRFDFYRLSTILKMLPKGDLSDG